MARSGLAFLDLRDDELLLLEELHVDSVSAGRTTPTFGGWEASTAPTLAGDGGLGVAASSARRALEDFGFAFALEGLQLLWLRLVVVDLDLLPLSLLLLPSLPPLAPFPFWLLPLPWPLL